MRRGCKLTWALRRTAKSSFAAEVWGSDGTEMIQWRGSAMWFRPKVARTADLDAAGSYSRRCAPFELRHVRVQDMATHSVARADTIAFDAGRITTGREQSHQRRY